MYSGVTPYFTWFLIPIFFLKLSQAGATPVAFVSPLAIDSSAREQLIEYSFVSGLILPSQDHRVDCITPEFLCWLTVCCFCSNSTKIWEADILRSTISTQRAPPGFPPSLGGRPQTPQHLFPWLSPKLRPQVCHRIPLPNCGLCQVPTGGNDLQVPETGGGALRLSPSGEAGRRGGPLCVGPWQLPAPLGGWARDEGCGVERQQQGQAQRVDLSYLNITQDALSTQSFIFMI